MATRVEIRVAWGEMDAYGHVNNTVFLRWLETARIEWFEAVDFPEVEGKLGPVLRTANLEYLLPVKYPDTIEVSVTATRVGRASVTLAYELRSLQQAGRPIVAKGETVVVLVDFGAGESVELDAAARERIGPVPAQPGER